jgi:signal transduction histidine kinase
MPDRMTEFCFAARLSLQDLAAALAPGLATHKPIMAAGGLHANGEHRLVFASASMLRLFGASGLEELSDRLFVTGGPGAARLAALAESLPVETGARREKLRFSLGDATRQITFLYRRLGRHGAPALFIAAALDGDEAAKQPDLSPGSAEAEPRPPPPDRDDIMAAGAGVTAPAGEWTRGDQDVFEAIALSLGGKHEPVPLAETQGTDDGEERAAIFLPRETEETRAILDVLPLGVLVFRGAVPIFGNRLVLDRLGCADIGLAYFSGALDGLVRSLRQISPAPEAIVLRMAGGGNLLARASAREIEWGAKPATLVWLEMTPGGAEEAPSHGAPLQEAGQDLDAARRQAEQASALKSQFLAKVSHEIRTPLNAILGFAEVILEERFGPLGNERYKSYLKDIHASGSLVASLVNDILDLSKIEAGKMDLDFAAVDANRIIAECVSIMQPQASRERVVVRLALSPHLPEIFADERSLRQIALNLLSNAVKFNQPGGQVIVATALTDVGHAVLRIRDTGVGMSEDEVDVAMEPFRQLATARKRSGTGLGLPLTKALVEANHAVFAITSTRDKGTLVEVTFPLAHPLAHAGLT